MFGDLFRAEGETMGVKLLQKMGWRRGQGVGPKVRRRADGDKTGDTHLFAPENSSMISFDRKNDRKGLGFAGENKLRSTTDTPDDRNDDPDESDQDARILRTNRSKLTPKPKKLKKSGFGVGVLNDNGSDDEDPYAMGPQISYNRIIGGQEEEGWPEREQCQTRRSEASTRLEEIEPELQWPAKFARLPQMPRWPLASGGLHPRYCFPDFARGEQVPYSRCAGRVATRAAQSGTTPRLGRDHHLDLHFHRRRRKSLNPGPENPRQPPGRTTPPR